MREPALHSGNKKKISFIAHDLAGGGMTRTYVLAQALNHAGYSVEILGLKLTSGDIYPVPPSNITVTEVTGHNVLHRMVKLVKILDSDIVYAIKPRPSSYGIALLNRLISGRPVLLDIDDNEDALGNANSTPQIPAKSKPRNLTAITKKLKIRMRKYLDVHRWVNPADKRFIRWMSHTVHKANAITVNTRCLHKLYGGTYLPHCRDIKQYDPDRYDPDHCREKYGLSDYTVLMFPGTPRAHKGLEDILAAIELLNRPDLRLVLVGGRSSGNSYIRELIQRWGKWIIRLPGFPAEEMPEIVAAAHIIVIPQRDTAVARAQAPMKLTDAMAMAKPILSTNVGDISEILHGTGFLTDPSNPSQLASTLEYIISHPQEARDRGRKARERFVSFYSLEIIGPTLAGIIESLAPATGIPHE